MERAKNTGINIIFYNLLQKFSMIKTIIDFSLWFRTVSLYSRNESDLKPHCIFPVRLWNWLISGGLEPVLSNTEKSCSIKLRKVITTFDSPNLLALGAKKTSFNLIIEHFHIRGKLFIILRDKYLYLYLILLSSAGLVVQLKQIITFINNHCILIFLFRVKLFKEI